MVKGMGALWTLSLLPKNIIVAMQHTDKAGNSNYCLPALCLLQVLNASRKKLQTWSVLKLHRKDSAVVEYAPGVSIDEIKSKTAGRLVIADDVKEIAL